VTTPAKYPFEVRDVYFVELNFSRAASVPQPLTLAVTVGARLDRRAYPECEIGLRRVIEPEDPPVRVSLELVGKFGSLEETSPPGPEALGEFIDHKALPMLWSYGDAMMRNLTAALGVPVIKLLPPLSVSFSRDIVAGGD
jgi:hypothetical protein